VNRLTELLQLLGRRFGKMSLSQQITAGTLLIAILVAGFFVFQQTQDDYDVLYANLNVADASAIAAKLKEEKRPYKVADNGTTILVPRGEKNNLILSTANELTGHQTVNLNQIPPMVSGDVQKEWIRSLNTNTIINVLKGIKGIQNAQVIVSQPEKNLFVEQQLEPTASVMLMVEPGFRLHEDQVKTIKNLVAHAVPGLKSEQVAIADNAGNSLEGPGAGGFNTIEHRQKSFEDETAKKVAHMLVPIVGRDNVVVSVSARLNFDQQQSEIHRILPSGGDVENPKGVAISAQTQSEVYSGKKGGAGSSGTNAGAGGEPGIVSNTSPSYINSKQNGEGADKNNDYRFDKSTINYEVSKEDKRVIHAAGTVERLTVAVVLNKVLTSQETQEIRDLVANAAGIDTSRGDSIDIKGFQFTQGAPNDEAGLAAAAKEAQTQAFMLQMATLVVVGILIVVAVIFVFMMLRQPLRGELLPSGEGVALNGAPGAGGQYDGTYGVYPMNPMLDSAGNPIAQLTGSVGGEAGPPATIETILDPEVEHMREAINNVILDDPQEATRLLLTYMKDM